ncbi:MAG: lysoplasmalogenase [Candidatus Atribacteria bacterium]|nr:lysoplasmalogenase [Candidatus Atribacteria bacterium]
MLTTLLFIAVLAVAVADWVAVAKGWKKIETIAKPMTMVLLFAYLALACGFGATPLIYFGLGIFFSLAGDIFLMISYARFSNRWFLPGLAAFLLAHMAYIIGLNMPFGEPSPLWAIGIGIILAMTAGRILRRILAGVREKGLRRLVVPVMAYGMVITLMLLSAILTIYRVDWKTSASGLVCLGAILFYFSDIILAWNKFVKPVRNGRVMNMAAYHLGQIALIAGVVLQFAR